MDLDFEDKNIKKILKKTNQEYDEYTVQTIKNQFQIEFEKNNKYLNLINQKIFKNSSVEYSGLFIGRDVYNIYNLEEFLKLIINEFILYDPGDYKSLIKKKKAKFTFY